jgi:hypothetical protein
MGLDLSLAEVVFLTWSDLSKRESLIMSKPLVADPGKASRKISRIGRPPNPVTLLFAPRKRAYGVKEAARELSVSAAQIRVLIARGLLAGKKISGTGGTGRGARLIIEGDELDRFLAELPAAELNMPSVTGGATQSK